MTQNFFSLEIRDLNFDYDRYYLSLEKDINKNILLYSNLEDNKNIKKNDLPNDAISGITSYTLIPKFPIDQVLSPILYQIFNIDFNIINKKEEEIENKKDDKKDDKKDYNNNIKISGKEEDKFNEENNKNNGDNAKEEKINDDAEKNELILEDEKNIINEKIKAIKEFKINVKSFTSKKIICSFNVRYPLFPEYYDVLGKSPDKFRILQFPCILLQSDSGYYSLKKIITTIRNNKITDEEINLAIKIEPEKYFEPIFIKRQHPMKKKNKIKLDFEKILQSRGLYDSTLSSLNDKKQELLNKKKELNSIIEERKKKLEEKQKILLCHKNIEITKNSWNRLVTLKEILTKINAYIIEIISIKEKKTSSSNNEIKKYKKEVNNKRKKEINTLQKINNGLGITNDLLYKYSINELCYYFFNIKINSYKAFPSFYKINLTDLSLSKKIVEEFYNRNTKDISAMFGNIIFLLNYISKKFDIIFPYALYYNGSKSMIFMSIGEKNWAIDMYMKENEKMFWHMEQKMRMIHN